MQHVTEKESYLVIRLSDVVKHQAIINVGTNGHVSHGKSTTIRELTGKKTQQHSSEKKTNNRTVKLGYANCKVFYNPINNLIRTASSKVDQMTDPTTGDKMQLVNHISFPDTPGHYEFMATMIAGSKVMDRALLIVSAAEKVPQPQTYEHLLATQQTTISDITVIQNKLDLLTKPQAEENYSEIREFIRTSPVIREDQVDRIFPISAEMGYNMDALKLHLAQIKPPKREYDAPVKMTVVRSFNINKPSINTFNLKGAVIGGTIHQGILTVGDRVELGPGIIRPTSKGIALQPLLATVKSIQSDVGAEIEYAVPGGLIGVELSIDPGLATNDRLVGFELAHPGSLNPTYNIINGTFNILPLLGEKFRLKDITPGDKFKIVSGGSMQMLVTVTSLTDDHITIQSKMPVTVEHGTKLAVLGGDQMNKLVGTITVLGGKLTVSTYLPEEYQEWLDWESPKYDVIDDLPKIDVSEQSYSDLLDNIIFRDEKDIAGTLRIPSIITSSPTRHLMNITNTNEILAALDCSNGTAEHLIDIRQLLLNYFKLELHSSCRYVNNLITMDCRKPKEAIQATIVGLLYKVFRCPSCQSTCQTVITKAPREKLYTRRCLMCPSQTTFKNFF